MLRSFYIRILRSLFEIAAKQENPEIVAVEIILAAINIFGWKPAAVALAAFADEHNEADQLHAYLRQPNVQATTAPTKELIE